MELRDCMFECMQSRRYPVPEPHLDCMLYPKPHDIDVSVSGQGCEAGIEATIRANYLACLNAKKAQWLPLIQAHCQKYNQLTDEMYQEDCALAELQFQLCLERCELDNCLAQAQNVLDSSLAICFSTLQTQLQVCDNAYAQCVANQQPNCWEQYLQCVADAYAAYDSCVAQALSQYNDAVFFCYASHWDSIRFLEWQIAESEAKLSQLREERAITLGLRQQAWNNLVAAYGQCFAEAQAEAEAMSHPSPNPELNCVVTVSLSGRPLDIDP